MAVIQTRAAVTAASASGVTARSGPQPTRFRRLPYLVSRLFFVGALLLLLQALFPFVFWLGPIVDVYSTVFVPIDGGSHAAG